MDTAAFFEGVRVFIGFLSLLFIPGFIITLVYFPRLTDIGIIQRLAYSTVMSIGSVIALVLFMDVVLGVDSTPGNIITGIGVFSGLMLILWFFELLYLKSRFKKNLEPRIVADYEELQRFYSREVHAARDRFRQDTRTVVMYHESQQSGMNHIDHIYLMDIGKEIDIPQVAENKLKVTDSVLVAPPYPRTAYFELAIREYREDALSLIDDLQVYPVLITRKPDRKFLWFILRHGSTHIAERIYKKTSTTEVQWIYSHDFHLFGITHADDTLDMMVDRIMGKLDEIGRSAEGGEHAPTSIDEQRMFREVLDEVKGKTDQAPALPGGSPGRLKPWPGVQAREVPAVQPGTGPYGIPKWPAPPGSEPAEGTERPEVRPEARPPRTSRGPSVSSGFEPGDSRPENQINRGTKETRRRSAVLFGVGQKEVSKNTEQLSPVIAKKERSDRYPVQPVIEPEEIPPAPEVQAGELPPEIPERPAPRATIESLVTPKWPVIGVGAQSPEIPEHPEPQATEEPRVIPKWPVIGAGTVSPEILERPAPQATEEPRVTPKWPVIGESARSPEIPERPAPQATIESRTHTWPEVRPGLLPKEITKRPVIQPPEEPRVTHKWPEVRPGLPPKEITKRPVIQPPEEPRVTHKWPEVRPGVPPKEITKRPVIQPPEEPRGTHKWPEVRSGIQPHEIPKSPVRQPGIGPLETPRHQEARPGIQPREIPKSPVSRPDVGLPEPPKHPEVRLGIQPKKTPPVLPEDQPGADTIGVDRQELRSGILRNLDVFSITPDTFGGSKKNIENIPIPKKSDVNKKLSELEEDKDWLDLSWLYD